MKNTMKGGKNKMNKMVLTVSAVLVALLLVGGVYAYQNGNRNVNSTVDRTAAEKAIESGDYAAWSALHANSNGRMASAINESNFYLLKEMHDARETGDLARVQEIRSELGLNNGNNQGKGKGLGMGMHRGNGNCPMMDSND
jgi:hypothetical protein